MHIWLLQAGWIQSGSECKSEAEVKFAERVYTRALRRVVGHVILKHAKSTRFKQRLRGTPDPPKFYLPGAHRGMTETLIYSEEQPQ